MRSLGCAKLPPPMPTCDHCDEHISDRFAKVFADQDGRVRACPNCSATAGIAQVALARGREEAE